MQKEEPVPPEGSLREEESGETKSDVQTDDTAPKQEPAKDFTKMQTSLETKMIQFFENCDCVNVFQMVIMVNGQTSTIKVIQLLLNIDICSGMSNTERPWLHIKITGIQTLMIN